MNRQVVRAAVIDVVVVVVFVLIGRRNHDEGTSASGVLGTAAPFLIALVATWAAGRVWRSPVATNTGFIVWAGTVAVGMVLRRFVFDDGTATAFVIVATVFLGAGLTLPRLALRYRSFRNNLER